MLELTGVHRIELACTMKHGDSAVMGCGQDLCNTTLGHWHVNLQIALSIRRLEFYRLNRAVCTTLLLNLILRGHILATSSATPLDKSIPKLQKKKRGLEMNLKEGGIALITWPLTITLVVFRGVHSLI